MRIETECNRAIEANNYNDGSALLRVQELRASDNDVTAYLEPEQREAVILALGGNVDPKPEVFKENAAFEDIKVGDKVRRVITYPDGATVTNEGVVEGGCDALSVMCYTKDGIVLARRYAIDNEVVTILERKRRAWRDKEVARDKDFDLWVYRKDDNVFLPLLEGVGSWGAEACERLYGPLEHVRITDVEVVDE